VPEPHDVALGVEEGFHVIRIEAGEFDGVRDTAFDVLIECFEDILLVGQQDGFAGGIKGVGFKAEV
jgi:hypothetical protein